MILLTSGDKTMRIKHAVGYFLTLFLLVMVGLCMGQAFAQTVSKVVPTMAHPPTNVVVSTTAKPPTNTQTTISATSVANFARLRQLSAWKHTLLTQALPKMGCFKVSFPATDWKPTPCKKAPGIPYTPHHIGNPYLVGGSAVSDFSAQLPSDTITTAWGTFDSVSSGITESGPSLGAGKPLADTYSLQLNTNMFNTPMCSGALPGAPCQGWQQFVYANHGAAAELFIQYWLLSYNTGCPAGWTTNAWTPQGTTVVETDCYFDSASTTNNQGAIPVPTLAVADLPQAILAGSVTKGADGAIFLVGSDAYALASNDPLVAEQQWHIAEFNIFGDGDLSQATFGPNSKVLVHTYASGMLMTSPVCLQAGFTGETNNLDLSGVPSLPGANDNAPASIAFVETNANATPAGCNTIGGTGSTLELLPGNNFVDWANDTTGLKHYLSGSGATMCVVHNPSCGSVGHNGKEHFFPKDHPLPAGVTLKGVMYTAYWPPGLTKTDRGGAGSEGAYGDDADASIQSTLPLFSVHWQNACQAVPFAHDWRFQNNAYQVSFVIDVPNGVVVDGAVPLTAANGPVCSASDTPSGNPTSSVIGSGMATQPVMLSQVTPANGGFVGWQAIFPAQGLQRNFDWNFLSIENPNSFTVVLVKAGHTTADCGTAADVVVLGSLKTTTDLSGFFNVAANNLDLVACTQGATVPSGVSLEVTYTY